MRTGAGGERFEDFTGSAHLPETAECHRPPVGERRISEECGK